MVMTYARAKVQDQRLVGSKDGVETNERTNGWAEVIALRAALMPSVNMSHDEASTEGRYVEFA